MATKFTPEEKRKYFQDLRNQWRKAKEDVDNPDIKAKYKIFCQQSPNQKVSPTSFAFILKNMQALGYDGLPYIDCKTFNGWKESGFKVKKGETSKFKGVVWMGFKDKDGEDRDTTGAVYPKLYSLFHRDQVEALVK